MIRFVFFDLGNVLVRFSIDRLTQQGAELTGRSTEKVRQAVFGSGMERKLELGQTTEEEFYEHFCNELGCRPGPEAVAWAMNDIFEENEGMHPITRRLAEIDFPRGILSNTGPSHWNHCCTFFPFILDRFPTNHVLSYKIGVMKPDHEIYLAALSTAERTVPGVRPEEVLFVDDLEKNVIGAREFGFDAVQYVTDEQLQAEFVRRLLHPLPLWERNRVGAAGMAPTPSP